MILHPQEIRRLVNEQNNWRQNCINLIASENVGMYSNEIYNSDLQHRYAEGEPFKRYYNGTKYIDIFESNLINHFENRFKKCYVDIKPLSGAMSNTIVFSAIKTLYNTKNIMVNSLPNGGHITHNNMGFINKVLNINTVPFAIMHDNPYLIDVQTSIEKAKFHDIDVFIFGKSMFLHEEPLKEFRKAFPKALFIYDAAHVFGLIYQKQFQKNIMKYCDIITASTHKTFPGPQGGIIICKDKHKDLIDKMKKISFPGMISNHHLHRIPAMLEVCWHLKNDFKDYSKIVIETAQKFARLLKQYGVSVEGMHKQRYTHTHQVVIRNTTKIPTQELVDKLEELKIICNKNALPDDKSVLNPSGIRFGVQEMVAKDFKEWEIVAKAIAIVMRGEI